jgi:hypothetical protein
LFFLTLLTGCIEGWDTLSVARDLRLEQVVVAVKSVPNVSLNWSYPTNVHGNRGFHLWVERDGVEAFINFHGYDAHQRVGNLEILSHPFSPKAARLVEDLYTAIHRQCPEVTDSPKMFPLARGGV